MPPQGGYGHTTTRLNHGWPKGTSLAELAERWGITLGAETA